VGRIEYGKIDVSLNVATSDFHCVPTGAVCVLTGDAAHQYPLKNHSTNTARLQLTTSGRGRELGGKRFPHSLSPGLTPTQPKMDRPKISSTLTEACLTCNHTRCALIYYRNIARVTTSNRDVAERIPESGQMEV
jgi:hypothetical protein